MSSGLLVPKKMRYVNCAMTRDFVIEMISADESSLASDWNAPSILRWRNNRFSLITLRRTTFEVIARYYNEEIGHCGTMRHSGTMRQWNDEAAAK